LQSKWRQVPIDQAKGHPLYGIGGWLIVFAVLLAFGLLKGIGEIGKIAADADIGFFDLLREAEGGFFALVLVLGSLQVGVIYYLMATRSSSFRNVSSVALLLGEPITWCVGALASIPEMGRIIVESGLIWLISSAVWISYLQKSKRVRVTFENSVLSEPEIIPKKPARQDEMALNEKSDESLWEKALNEFDSDRRMAGLWAKAYSEANGDEGKAKAFYLKERVRQFSAKL
jgi:hypothetical protein